MIASAIALAAAWPCTPVRVWDGDGPIWCAEGPRVRLAGVAARELDGRCRRAHPCPRAGGEAARDALVQLLGGPRGRSRDGHVLVRARPMRCRSAAPSYGRVVAWCTLTDGRDVSCALWRAKVVVRWMRFGGARVCR